MVTSDSASRELEGVPFVPAGSEERRTHRSLRSAASFQRRSTALRAFACGENSLSCVRSERALASNLLEIEMTFAVVYGPERQHTNFFDDPEDAAEFAYVVDGVVSDLDNETGPYFDEFGPF